METICQLTEENKILRDQIKICPKQMKSWQSKYKTRKNNFKMKVSLQNWNQTDIVGLIVVGSPRVIALYSIKQRRTGTRAEPQGQTI